MRRIDDFSSSAEEGTAAITAPTKAVIVKSDRCRIEGEKEVLNTIVSSLILRVGPRTGLSYCHALIKLSVLLPDRLVLKIGESPS